MLTSVNLSNRLSKQLTTEIEVFLHTIGDAASRLGYNTYLVGGAVRDLLLGTSTTDIDIVVEGNAITLVKSLPLGHANVKVHPAFGTANLKWNHTSIDLATARSEIYPQPGQLPEVTPSNINRDLFRRDFTINAMAVSLNRINFGELIDPYRGLADLKNRLIRILHEKSFIDDATRIWRAIRYEQRLNFKIEPETLTLLKRDTDMLDTITGDRVRRELELVLRENKPEKVLNRAGELKVLTKITGGLVEKKWLAEKYNEARALGLSDTSLITVYFSLLIYSLNIAELNKLTTYLRFTRPVFQILKNTLELKEQLPVLEVSSLLDSKVYFTLNEYPELAVIANLVATDNSSIKKHIENYLTRLRHIKPRLNGNDLKRLGIPQSPEINKLLHILYVAKLDKKVITKQGETRLVYNWLRERENNKTK